MTGEEFFLLCMERFAPLPVEKQLELLKAFSWEELTEAQRERFEQTARKIHMVFREFDAYERVER